MTRPLWAMQWDASGSPRARMSRAHICANVNQPWPFGTLRGASLLQTAHALIWTGWPRILPGSTFISGRAAGRKQAPAAALNALLWSTITWSTWRWLARESSHSTRPHWWVNVQDRTGSGSMRVP